MIRRRSIRHSKGRKKDLQEGRGTGKSWERSATECERGEGTGTNVPYQRLIEDEKRGKQKKFGCNIKKALPPNSRHRKLDMKEEVLEKKKDQTSASREGRHEEGTEEFH